MKFISLKGVGNMETLATDALVNSTTTFTLSIADLIKSIILSYVLSYVLARFFVRNANSLSNHENLASIFPLLAITVTIVIAVVKSSLALSLGLVGALSIVRFRTPIKEPEELTYIFLCIAIGLASGANQYLAAIIGLLLALIGTYINKLSNRRKGILNTLRLTIKGINADDSNAILKIVCAGSKRVDLNNFIIGKESENFNTITFSIQPISYKETQEIVDQLSLAFPKATISLMDIKNF